MSKRRIEKCENIEFLPIEFQDTEDLITTEKNVLSTLCMCHLKYSDFVKSSGGWFYTSIKDISIESGVDDRTVNRIIIKLRLKSLLATKRGTNHRCTWYKLAPQIAEKLPVMTDSLKANVILDGSGSTECANVALDKTDTPSTVNVALDKIRLDESSKDESRAIEKKEAKTAKDAAFVAAPLKKKTEEQLEAEFQTHKERIFKELEASCNGKSYNTVNAIVNAAISSFSNLCIEPYYERLRKVVTLKGEKLKQQSVFGNE